MRYNDPHTWNVIIEMTVPDGCNSFRGEEENIKRGKTAWMFVYWLDSVSVVFGKVIGCNSILRIGQFRMHICSGCVEPSIWEWVMSVWVKRARQVTYIMYSVSQLTAVGCSLRIELHQYRGFGAGADKSVERFHLTMNPGFVRSINL